jgi:hypothetical protein
MTVATPTPTGPANGVGALRPAFTWTPVGGAIAYVVRVDDVSAGQQGIFSGRVSVPIWAPPANLISGRTYSWQVRALNAAGLGEWAAPATFAVGKAVPIGPGGSVSGLRPTFTWAGLPGAANYQLRVDDLTTGQTNVFLPLVSMDQAWTPAMELRGGHMYRWWVRAVIPGASGAWQGAWSVAKDFRIV